MQPGTSPNDPVFFFHHCNIDRLWAVWEQKNPAAAPYLPDNSTAAANGLTRLNENMATFGRTPTDRYFGVDVTPGGVVNSKAIAWYDSDLPELHNETGGNLAFVGVPEGLTTYKAVKFRIVGCRPVHFRITGAPTGQFGLTTMGTEFTADPDDGADFYYGYVWVKLTAVAGAIASSSVQIHAYILDQEGYDASVEGGEYPLGDVTVTLTATTIARQSNAVALVLDRSGSMADGAGGTSTKTGLLKNAVSVFNSLMLPDDEIALVSFDDEVATPASMQSVSAGAVPPVLAGPDLDPRNLTCIGGGILQGAVELGLATHTNKSMIVLTDGVENVHPYVAELPAGTISARTYAIGFGMPADISTPVLNQITSNTHGDLIITGNITTAEQGFNLTKYFVQVLAGVSNMNVLLDPQGALFFGSEDVIPFDVTDADVYLDVIALCPVPDILDFKLQTPSGTIIDAAATGPNIQYVVDPQVAFYRVTLPALADEADGSHAGRWKAILTLPDRKKTGKLLKKRGVAEALRSHHIGDYLPYSLVAHAYSNLQFDAKLHQDSLQPGTNLTLRASLSEYDVPFTDDASVWADIATPDGDQTSIPLSIVHPGRYAASFTADLPGVYSCRVRSEGYFSGKDKFTREKTLTAATYLGDYSTSPPKSDTLCELLHCLTGDHGLTQEGAEKLRELGVDVEALTQCMERHCPKPHEHPRPDSKEAPSSRRSRSGGAELAITSIPTAQPIDAPPAPAPPMAPPVAPQSPRIIHMFTRPEQSPPGMAMGEQARPQSSTMAFPRIVRMFTHPDEVAVEDHETDDPS
jgi:hypothetical protein